MGINDYLNQDLTKSQMESAKKLMLALYAQTCSEWNPGNCRNIPPFAGMVNNLIEALGIKEFGPFKAQHYSNSHFFLTSKMDDEREFVFDPTGVPVEKGKIIPYIGLLEASTGMHKVVYESRQAYKANDN